MARGLLRLGKWVLITLAGSFVLVALALVVFRWQAHAREMGIPAEAAPVTGRFVDVRGVSIFVQETVPATGPVVVFVHGMGAWSEIWRETMTAVGADGFRAVALDLPPFGYSDKRRAIGYTRRAQAERILGVLDALDIRRAILVGHSFGGGPTMEATLLAPERVRLLVLADAAIGLDDAGAGDGGWVLAALRIRALRNAIVSATVTNPLLTRRLLSSFVADPRAVTEARLGMLQRPMVVRGSTDAFGEWLLEFLASRETPLSKKPDTYASLDLPTLVIWGDRDTTTPLPQGKRLAALIRGAELAVMAGVGHMPQIEDTAQFNRLLLDFLRKHGR